MAHTRAAAPGLRYVHVADRVNFPYGRKTPAEIQDLTLSLTERLIEREKPAIVVVACNTMSVFALEELRARFTIPFVGVVPAVKPAAAISRKRSIGVLATTRTVEGGYLQELVDKFADGCKVAMISAQDLVDFVETGLYGSSEETRMLRVGIEARKLKDNDVDAVVLACTHYVHLEEEFRREMGPEVAVVDSREGVTRQTLRLLGGRGQPSAHGRDALYVTGKAPIEDRYGYFAGKFGMELAELP